MPILSQTKTNLDLIYELIDHSVLKADSLINKKSINYHFVYTSPDQYSFLKTNIVDSYKKAGISIIENNTADAKLEHTIKNISVVYSNPVKDGFFGDLFIERTIHLDASVILSDKSELKTYNLSRSYKDTVEAENINRIENPAIPFTQSTIPELPFLSNLLEPIIVVGTLIVTIILFFTVRSK